MSAPILQIRNLKKYFPIEKGAFKKRSGYVRAVDDISFDIRETETVGLVGESGCGKSTTGNCIVRLLDPDGGAVEYIARNGETVDLAAIKENKMKKYRSEIQMIFQDPYSSLNPRMNVQKIISEPMGIFSPCKPVEMKERVAGLMERVGLHPEYMKQYPHAFSGGQRQRVGIARALALNPRLLVCDESLSSLDVSVQAQILGLLEELRDEYCMSYLFIAHDLSVVRHICDRVVVMYVGKVCEIAETNELFEAPRHPYTEALLASVPKIVADRSTAKLSLSGEVPDPSNPPEGCFFHPRCEYATAECAVCTQELHAVGSGGQPHLTSCIHHDKLHLRGVESRRTRQE